jgi:probable O-glycosylation ligase (exosortase A-associated)
MSLQVGHPPARLSRARVAPRRVDWIWILLVTAAALEYIRPMDNELKFLAPLRIGGLVAMALTVLVFVKQKSYLKNERIYQWVLAFWVLVSLGSFWATNNRSSFNTGLNLFWMFTAFSFPINLALTSPQRVYRFFFWWVAIQAALGLHVATHGGHGPGSFLTDENDVGLAMNMAIPYMIYLTRFPDISGRTRLLLYGAIGLMLAAVGICASRGAIVGIALSTATMILLSKKPIRNGIIALAVVLASLAILIRFLPPAYVKDMQGIDDPNDSTADERLWSWSIGWVMYKHNPVIGVGAGNYQWTNHLYATESPMYTPDRKILGGRVAHSLYFTLIPELGTVGIIMFIAILKLLFDRCKKLRNLPADDPAKALDRQKFELIGKAMTVSIVAYLVTGAFISVLYYPPFWHLIGMVAATHAVAKGYFEQGKSADAV